jgi:hypothetical protein
MVRCAVDAGGAKSDARGYVTYNSADGCKLLNRTSLRRFARGPESSGDPNFARHTTLHRLVEVKIG